MNNKIEKFIRDHRQEFDDGLPSGEVWKNIEKNLGNKKSQGNFTIRDIYKWSAAAAIFFMLLTSVYFIFIKKDSHGNFSENEISKYLPAGEDAASIDPVYVAAFRQAGLTIEKRQEELKTAVANHPELYQKFQDDLNTLDSAYKLLREKASQSINQDVIIKAMIQNLQLQSALLARQLIILKEIKPTKTSKNEKSI